MNAIPSLAAADWLQAPPLRRILEVIAAAGGEARVAGGAVRNALMGEPVTEVDLATTLSPEAVSAACMAQGLGVHPTGIAHGTLTVVADHQPFEVTTLRHDVETDGRRAIVQFTDDWRADARRRDFTINALYCDASGTVYDYVGGYADILRRRVSFVGSPAQRISEDYLRILRFFRFHARYGEGDPDAAGLAACVAAASHLDGLSAERVRQEMFKLMVAPGAIATLQLMAASGILGRLLPYTEDWSVLTRLPPDPILRLAILAREPLTMKDRWRLSNHEVRRLEALVSLTPPQPGLRPQEQRVILYEVGRQAWCDMVLIGWARSGAAMDDPAWQELFDLPEHWQAPVFPVSGRDLLAMGMAPGPGVGDALRKLEDWWMASGFAPGRQDLLDRLK
ncbi:CCA tRNA nucleotidyltransferase [Aestuariivirga sp.]|jgi:poly(A) polymerase|uniref:CCA tRNA nucleotidyltransferase n=1 Tax=Aestuariivirga sp. TaxID=2650926 RepID=UPI0037846C08